MKYNLRLFKIAKLAKDKGFTTHTITTKFTNDYLLGGKNMMINETCILLWMCELQKWLREVHKINIFISSKTIENKTIFIPHGRTIPDTIKNNLIVDIIQYCTNNTYEEALEIALFEALKLI